MNVSFKVEIEKPGVWSIPEQLKQSCQPTGQPELSSDPLSWSWGKGKECWTISFTTENLREMLNIMMHSCIPSTWGMEAGGSGL